MPSGPTKRRTRPCRRSGTTSPSIPTASTTSRSGQGRRPLAPQRRTSPQRPIQPIQRDTARARQCRRPAAPVILSHQARRRSVMINLTGKTALVTGGSRGIGRAAALALASAGAQVLVHYGRAEVEADAVLAEIRGAGGRAEKIGTDLSDPQGPQNLAAR